MDETTDKYPPVTSLSKMQRRVLGVLVEKALTVPESYPLTLKSLTSGCNQKSNRDPVVEYSEDDVRDTIEQLREMGLAAVVHTESGRTERFRHYLRHRFSFSEPQVAIITELLLRGRQQPGELRTRASRMVAIDSQDSLRQELQGLIDQKLVQTNGPLDRRGVEVDHTLYRDNENRHLSPMAESHDEPRAAAAALPVAAAPPTPRPMASAPAASPAGGDTSRLAVLESTIAQLRTENRMLRDDIDTLKSEFAALERRFDDLKTALGG